MKSCLLSWFTVPAPVFLSPAFGLHWRRVIGWCRVGRPVGGTACVWAPPLDQGVFCCCILMNTSLQTNTLISVQMYIKQHCVWIIMLSHTVPCSSEDLQAFAVHQRHPLVLEIYYRSWDTLYIYAFSRCFIFSHAFPGNRTHDDQHWCFFWITGTHFYFWLKIALKIYTI